MAVSHADPIKAAVASAAGTHLDLFQRLIISPVLGRTRRAAYGDGRGAHVLTVRTPTASHRTLGRIAAPTRSPERVRLEPGWPAEAGPVSEVRPRRPTGHGGRGGPGG